MQRLLLILLFGFLSLAVQSVTAVATELRFALVVGNATYKDGSLATPINNASLIAQALQETGFQVSAQRDLDETKLRKAFSDFVTKIGSAGPDVVAVVYFAGQGLQLRGENYLLPIDADVAAIDEVPARAVGLSDEMRSLAALHLKASILILDEARVSATSQSRSPSPAAGFAWVESEPDMLVAFNAAPGTVVRHGHEGVDPYATALAEMMRDGDQSPDELFQRVRLRVSELTAGAQVPWHASKIDPQFVLVAQNPNAPKLADWRAYVSRVRPQPLKKIGVRDAYFVTLLRDTLDGYADFLADYWQDPMANRVQALLAARREAFTWWRSYQRNVCEAYWTYLDRYPVGPHVFDARSLLSRLGAPSDSPPRFTRLEYDVPPPLPDELPYLAQPGLMLDDAQFALAPPPPLPVDLVGPQSQKLSNSTPSPMAIPPIDGASIVPNAGASAHGAPPPPGPLAPSRLESGPVTGVIGSPIRQSDQFTAPLTPLTSNVASEAARVAPAAAIPSTQAPATPVSNPKVIDQASTSPGSGPATPANRTTNAAPATTIPTPQLGSLPRSAPVSRSTNAPTQTFGSVAPPSTGQPLPSRGSIQSGSTRSPPNVQRNSTVQSAPTRRPNQPISTVRPAITGPKVVGVPATKPDPMRKLPKAACSDLDGRDTCH